MHSNGRHGHFYLTVKTAIIIIFTPQTKSNHKISVKTVKKKFCAKY